MKKLFLLSVALLSVSCLSAQDMTSLFKVQDEKILQPAWGKIVPVCNCEDLKKLALPNTTIQSAELKADDSTCRVIAIVNNPPSNDRVTVTVALPVRKWNGRFYGIGGGGFMSGNPFFLNFPVSQGFACVTTDAGHQGGSGSFALDTVEHRLRWQEVRDFAYEGIHDMTVTGKELVKAFYGKDPAFSYFVGGSTGGRQAMMEAQRFPDDYDGIMSYFPAINWGRLLVADLWPQAVMNDEGNYVAKEKLDAVTKAVIAACDSNDGATDGVIDDPVNCKWDPKEYVGASTPAGVFTEADARVVRRIWEGAHTQDGKFLWYGMTRGTNLLDLTGTRGNPLSGNPFGISLEWVRYFLLRDPHWDIRSLTWTEFELLFNQSVDQYTEVIGTEKTDLTGFRDHGGKLIIMHGLADQLVAPQGTIEYFRKMQKTMGGPEATSKFARLFLVPGTNHSLGGAGSSPVASLDALVLWVEKGKAPDSVKTAKNKVPGRILKPF
jgi:hypothetical protein